MERFICIDTETTGLEPDLDRIIDLAAVEVVDRKVTGRLFESRVNPDGRAISYESYRIHRLTAEMLADAPPMPRVVDALERFADNAPLVIHNSAFDLSFLRPAYERAGRPFLLNKIIDSIDLARELWPGEAVSLDAVSRRLGLFDPARARQHGALVDARLLAQCWASMLTLRDQPRHQMSLLDGSGVARAKTTERPFRRVVSL